MNLAEQLLHQIDDSTVTRNERARLRCQLSKKLEESGDYEGAQATMGELWSRIGERPTLDGLDRGTAAEVLLHVGLLTSCIGSVRQIEGAQEAAKTLIRKSITIFKELQNEEKVAEAQTDLAICYWREGALDEARRLLQEVLPRLHNTSKELKLKTLLRSALVEVTATHYGDALRIIMGAVPLLDENNNDALKGKFHGQLANVLEHLGAAENREDYIDRALIEYAAASFHFEQAGNTRYCARVENNLGFLYLTINKFDEAH
jgi:tetratricopeptide (TPR) repeat protein